MSGPSALVAGSVPLRAGRRRAASSRYSVSIWAATSGKACRAATARPALARRRRSVDVLEQPQRDRARELGGAGRERSPLTSGSTSSIAGAPSGAGDRDAGGERLEREPPRAVTRRDEHRRTAQQQLACGGSRRACGARRRERTRSRACRDEHDLGAQRRERPRDRPRSAATARRGLDEHAGRHERLRSLVQRARRRSGSGASRPRPRSRRAPRALRAIPRRGHRRSRAGVRGRAQARAPRAPRCGTRRRTARAPCARAGTA